MAAFFVRRNTAATSTLFPSRHWQTATFVDAKLKWVRDRGLDHAVEKEKHLRPLHAVKDLLLRTTTTTSLPLSSISAKRDDLSLPFRPIKFIRRYPTAFIEHPPSLPPSPSHPSSTPSPSTLYQPTISPTPDLVRLHEEEVSVYDSCKEESAGRLLRLLMLTRRKKIPLSVVDQLRWDLGLPPDYVESLLPGFPDYFHIISPSSELELVCWVKDLAVSALERKAGSGYRKGEPLAFNVSFPREFQMDKKVKKWMEEWQKLPYVSPYDEEGIKLDKSSPVGEKWTVGMMHELLHLLVGKKAVKEEFLLLGEHVGLRSGFKKAIVNYPGIFYLSYRNMIQTVVLRDAYKRDAPVDKHPLMIMRYKYVHLMHKEAKEDAATARRQRSNVILGSDREDEGDGEDEEDGDDDEEEEEEEYSEDEIDDEADATVDRKVSASNVTSRKGQWPVIKIEKTGATPSSGPSLTERRRHMGKASRGRQGKRRKSSEGNNATMKSKADPTSELSSIEERLQTRKAFHDPRHKKWRSHEGTNATTMASVEGLTPYRDTKKLTPNSTT